MADHKTDGLTPAQKNFLSRRMAAGDELTEDRVKHYIDGHHRAVAAGHEIDSRKYFKAVATHADSMSPPRKPVAEQPIRPRYDGAATAMPKLRGSGDEFHALRKAATNNGRYGRKK